MKILRRRTAMALVAGPLMLAGCAALQPGDPVEVHVVGLEPLEGQGLEMRMRVKLRIQNPNEQPIAFDGVYVRIEVEGKTFATGVSNEGGTVPRYGEAVVAVPVSVSLLNLARQAMGVIDGGPRDRIAYVMTGKVSGPGFSSVRFRSTGELALPAGTMGSAR